MAIVVLLGITSHQRTDSECEGGEEDFSNVRVPEEFGEAHADGFESAAGGDDDADGHDGGGDGGGKKEIHRTQSLILPN